MIQSRILRAVAFLPVCLGALAFAAPARADVLPPNECPVENVGQACTTAGPSFNEDGICTVTTCHGASNPDASSSCTLCELADAGPSSHDGGSVDASLPKNHCPVESLNQKCSNAGPSLNEPGLCLIGPCDNGSSCSYCQVPDGGLPTTADATTTKDAGKPKTDAAKTDAGSTGNDLTSSSSCSASPVGTGGGNASLFFGLGALGLAVSAARRRRQ